MPSKKVIFSTQGNGVRVFHNLQKKIDLNSELSLEKVGYFVTDKHAYNDFKRDYKEFNDTQNIILSEWDILEKANQVDKVDHEYISSWENNIGNPYLWNALVSDRRLMYKVKAQFFQCYTSNYDHESLLKFLQVSIKCINEHFDEVEPDAIIGFNFTTYYSYLYYLISQFRGVPYFQLKLTRIDNYVSLYTDPFNISPHILEKIKLYDSNKNKLKNNELLYKKTESYLAKVKQNRLVYEGVSDKVGGRTGKKSFDLKSIPKKLNNISRSLSRYNDKDPHHPTVVSSILNKKILKPVYEKWLKRVVFSDSEELMAKTIKNEKFVFCPLNSEPEVALLVYGNSYRNQIETISNIAINIPVGWKLVVKEHPYCSAYRKVGFYKKLMQIPNLVLLGPDVNSDTLVKHSKLILAVYGTIGFEAIIAQKPLITFCKTPYATFPKSMVRYVEGFTDLDYQIKDLLTNYEYDEWSLINYVASHIETGVPVNLHTQLLGKSTGRVNFKSSIPEDEHYQVLAEYLFERIEQEENRMNKNN